MDALRSTTWLLSFGLHAGVVVALVGFAASGGSALDAGSGDDLVVVEQGIAVEGLANLGEAEEMIETVDIPPVQQAVEPRPIEEIEPELTEVITATESTHEEVVELQEPQPVVEEEKVAEVPVEEVAPQVATLELKSSGAEQTGGEANLYQIYQGKIRKAIGKHMRDPRTRRTGTVRIEFLVSPSGKLLSQKILKSSGSARLDKAAVDSLERAAPFPPIPDQLGDKPLSFTIPVNYRTE